MDSNQNQENISANEYFWVLDSLKMVTQLTTLSRYAQTTTAELTQLYKVNALNNIPLII